MEVELQRHRRITQQRNNNRRPISPNTSHLSSDASLARTLPVHSGARKLIRKWSGTKIDTARREVWAKKDWLECTHARVRSGSHQARFHHLFSICPESGIDVR